MRINTTKTQGKTKFHLQEPDIRKIAVKKFEKELRENPNLRGFLYCNIQEEMKKCRYPGRTFIEVTL